jgi:hypothetical protein
MDRSYLSSADVVEASRNFVCIRLATYEDAKEAEFLKQVFGRDGKLENTVFCFLNPNASERLTRAGRGPRFQFEGPAEMAEFMNQTAFRFPGKPDGESSAPSLPQMKNLRLALNVAACDGLPLVVVHAATESQRQQMAQRLSTASRREMGGKFHFYESDNSTELRKLIGSKPRSSFYVIEPDEFGQDGKLIRTLAADTDAESLAHQLEKVAASLSKPTKSHRLHVRAGTSQGIRWETEIPVTDEMAKKATERRQSRGARP